MNAAAPLAIAKPEAPLPAALPAPDLAAPLAAAAAAAQEPAGELALIQLRNLDALAKAQQAVLEGNRSLVEQLGEIFRAAAEKSLAAGQDLLVEADPKAALGKRFDLVKATMQDGIGNMNRLAELNARAGAQATQILQARTFAALDETRAMLERLMTTLPTMGTTPRA